MQVNRASHQIIADDLSQDEATQVAHIEGDDCEHATEEQSSAQNADDFSSLGDDERASLSAGTGLSIDQFLAPGGGYAGSEAPVRRAIAIGAAHGLAVTSLKRSSGSSRSDHHVSQQRSFAADQSNGSSPTPQMDATAQAIATALGHPNFRAGVLNVTHGSARAQLLWRTNVGGNHFNHVHYGVRIAGSDTPRFPQLTQPNMRGEEIRKIQQRLVDLGFSVGASGADGIFGPATDAAVRAFQKSRGLTVDGIVGPKTRAALG
jgi:hypothetical protein